MDKNNGGTMENDCFIRSSPEEVSQNLLRIMTQLQNLPPLEAMGGENWWTRLGEIERLYASAKEEALRAVPEEIDARRAIDQRATGCTYSYRSERRSYERINIKRGAQEVERLGIGATMQDGKLHIAALDTLRRAQNLKENHGDESL